MKVRGSLPIAVVILLAGCASVPRGDGIYRGEYFYNFETSVFTPEGGKDAWCVNSASLTDVELPANGAPGGPSGKADVVIRGVLSPAGSYCNMGAYKHFLDVKEVISVTNRRKVTP
jgi:hypothetical protein